MRHTQITDHRERERSQITEEGENHRSSQKREKERDREKREHPVPMYPPSFAPPGGGTALLTLARGNSGPNSGLSQKDGQGLPVKRERKRERPAAKHR